MTKLKLPFNFLENEKFFQTITDTSFDWEAWILPDGTYAYISPACERITGYSVDELMSRTTLLIDLVHPEDRERVVDHHHIHLDSHNPHDPVSEIEFRIIQKNGEVRWIWHQCQSISSSNGHWLGRRATNRDITSIKQTEEALRLSEKRLKSTQHIARLGHWHWDQQSNKLYLSDTIHAILELDSLTFKPGLKTILQIIHPDDRRQVASFFTDRANQSIEGSLEFRIQISDEQWLIIRAVGEDILDDMGHVVGRHGSYQDITDFKHAEVKLLLMDKIFDNTIEGIIVTDPDGTIEKMNPAGLRIMGYDLKDVIGKNTRIFKSDLHPSEFYAKMWDVLLSKGLWQGEILDRRQNGEPCPLQMTIIPLRDEQGQLHKLIGIFHDITEIKNQEKELQFQTYHDVLTGLPNRLLFLDRLKISLRRIKESDKKLAVIVVDIDDFKQINDALGHSIGDQLLQLSAMRIKQCVRENDTVARQGSDDFIVLLADITDIQFAVNITERICEVFLTPFIVGNQQLFVTVSAGITLSPDDGIDRDALISNADLAMYRAKEKGKNTYCLFTSDLNEKISRRLTLSTRLRNALEKDEFTVYYQPKVDVTKKCIIGVEALVRWEQEPGNIVSPLEFIPLAEETGLIVPLGKYVLRTACKQAAAWRSQGFSIDVAVNLSPRQFSEDDFLDSVSTALLENGLPAHMLELEITETLMMENEDLTIGLLWELKKKGIKISVDDFGTGYSSLAYLKQLPIDILKIDRSFVKDLPGNTDNSVLASTIINMAATLGLKVVAEGVETKDQLRFMCAHGCSYIQGYLFSPPLPAEKMIGLFEMPSKELFKELY